MPRSRARAIRLLIGVVVVSALASGCRTRAAERSRFDSAQAAHAAIVKAARAGDALRVFALLDRESRWSVMSCYRDKREIRRLVEAHYPAVRRGAELRRVQMAKGAPNAPAFFSLVAKAEGLLTPLARAPSSATPANTTETKDPARVELEVGGTRLAYCREADGWAFCGMRRQLGQLKLRVARDLVSVRENAETYRRE